MQHRPADLWFSSVSNKQTNFNLKSPSNKSGQVFFPPPSEIKMKQLQFRVN